MTWEGWTDLGVVSSQFLRKVVIKFLLDEITFMYIRLQVGGIELKFMCSGTS